MIKIHNNQKIIASPKYLFNVFCFVNAFVVLLHMIFYVNRGMTNFLFYIDILSFIVLAGSFCLSYFFGLFKKLYWPFLCCSVFLLSLLWFELGGKQGPVLSIFFILIIFFRALDDEKQHHRLILIVLITVLVDIGLEYFSIIEVKNFSSENLIFLNDLMLIIGSSFSVALMGNYIFMQYQFEQNKLGLKTQQLDEAVNDLQANNEILERIRDFHNSYLNAESNKTAYSELMDYLLDFTTSKFGLFAEIVTTEEQFIINLIQLSGLEKTKNSKKNLAENSNDWIESNGLYSMIEQLLSSDKTMLQLAGSKTKAFSSNFNNVTLFKSNLNGVVHGVIVFFDTAFDFPKNINSITPFITAFSTSLQNLKLKRSKKMYEKELNYAKDIAEENVRIKSLFLSNVSSELNQPLRMITGLMTTVLKLEKSKYNEEELNNTLHLVLENSNKILMFINEIMHWARIRSNTLDLHITQKNLYNFIVHCYEKCALEYSESSINFQLDYQLNKQIELEYDFVKIEKILKNLLSNAFKFTQADGTVQIIVREIEDYIRIAVKDNGPGLKNHDKDLLFKRFSFINNNEEVSKNGTGLGLFIAQELAKIQNFEIRVDTVHGAGSTFWFDLQKPQKFELPKLSAMTPLSEKKAKKLHKSKEGFQLLLVEDQKSMRIFVQSVLSDYNCDVAENGQEAIQLLKINSYDLVITDLMMPVMNGYDLIEWMKSNEQFIKIPLIVLTAIAGEENKIKLLKIGIDEYLLKPFSVDELKIRIGNVLANSIVRRQWSDENEEDWEQSQEKLRSEIEKRSSSGIYQQNQDDTKKLRLAESIITENLSNKKFSVDSFATKMMMSKRQLYRFLKSKVGMTPLAFIKEVKLQYARKILEAKTNNNIKEIAQMSGFMTVRNFSKNYKDRFARTPNSYFKKG